eukprot:1185329-Pyramimonas_sp.AAC.1
MLQNTERVIAQRVDATNAVAQPLTNRISEIEQRLPGAQDALAELRVGRAQTAQLGSPPTVYDFARLTDRLQEVETAADHAHAELSQVIRERYAK